MKVNPITEFFVTLVTGVVNASDFCRWVKDTYSKITDFHNSISVALAVVGIIVLAPVVVPVLGTVKGTAIIGAILGILGKGIPAYGHEDINIEENRTKDNSDEKKSSN